MPNIEVKIVKLGTSLPAAVQQDGLFGLPFVLQAALPEPQQALELLRLVSMLPSLAQ